MEGESTGDSKLIPGRVIKTPESDRRDQVDSGKKLIDDMRKALANNNLTDAEKAAIKKNLQEIEKKRGL